MRKNKKRRRKQRNEERVTGKGIGEERKEEHPLFHMERGIEEQKREERRKQDLRKGGRE